MDGGTFKNLGFEGYLAFVAQAVHCFLFTFFSKLWNSVIVPDQIPPAAINPKCPQQHV